MLEMQGFRKATAEIRWGTAVQNKTIQDKTQLGLFCYDVLRMYHDQVTNGTNGEIVLALRDAKTKGEISLTYIKYPLTQSDEITILTHRTTHDEFLSLVRDTATLRVDSAHVGVRDLKM